MAHYAMIHYGIYRGAVVGLRGAVVGLRGAAVGVRGAAVGNIGIPTYVISRGAVVRQPNLPQISCPILPQSSFLTPWTFLGKLFPLAGIISSFYEGLMSFQWISNSL